MTEQQYELYSLKQNRVYTPENAMKKKIGAFFILTDTDGYMLTTKVR